MDTTDTFSVDREFITLLSTMSPEAVVVYLYLLDRGYVQKELGVGLSAAELARSCGIAYSRVEPMLTELAAHERITVRDVGKIKELDLGNGKTIPFTFKNTDETKIKTLETEVRRLRLQNERSRTNVKSGLTEHTQGIEKDLYQEIETYRGFALDAVEGNLLGKCIQKFGPERTRATYRQMRTAKNPILATYAALQNGIKGQGAKQVESEPFTKVVYRDLD